MKLTTDLKLEYEGAVQRREQTRAVPKAENPFIGAVVRPGTKKKKT